MNDCTCPSRGESPHSMDCASAEGSLSRRLERVLHYHALDNAGYCMCDNEDPDQPWSRHVVPYLLAAICDELATTRPAHRTATHDDEGTGR